MKTTSLPWALLLFTAIVFSCTKSPITENIPPVENPPVTERPAELDYGDSIIYLNPQHDDYIVSPKEKKKGTYSGFPEGIEIDDKTGAINVSKSETGLRYRITFISESGDTSKTNIVLSGITFKDQYYYLDQGDSIASPVYNASDARVLPLSGSSFDDDNNANSGGCSVKTTDGKINLAQTARNGVFGSTPSNGAKKEFDIVYRLNDKSGKALNKIRVKVYYYDSMKDVDDNLLETLKERQDNNVFIGMRTAGSTTSSLKVTGAARPRPPCIIAIAHNK